MAATPMTAKTSDNAVGIRIPPPRIARLPEAGTSRTSTSVGDNTNVTARLAESRFTEELLISTAPGQYIF
jgi:hypothetical protein